MSLSAFPDRASPPGEGDLSAALGPAHAPWTELERRFPDLRGEWGYTGASTGWGYRLKDGDRVIVYMTPQRGAFLASFALGERAVELARPGLPAAVLDVVESARKYVEGRAVRLPVTSVEDLPAVVTLVGAKLATGTKAKKKR